MPNMLLTWQVLRVLKWVFWVATIGYYIECLVHRSAHQNAFGQLLHTSEFWLFGLPIAAVFAGFMEMAAREEAGLRRPEVLRDWSGVPAER